MGHLTYKTIVLTVAGTTFTGSTNSAAVAGALNVLEDSGMGDDDRTHLPGLHGKTFALAGWLDSTIEGVLNPWVTDRQTSSTAVVLTIGGGTYTGSCYLGNVQFSGNVDDLQTWSADCTVSGNLALS